MIKHSTVIALVFCLCHVVFAQMPQWSSIEIPGDSLLVGSLTFLDSLHGYLGVTQISEIIDTTNNQKISRSFYFETTDGGKKWEKITDSTIASPQPSIQYNSSVLFSTLSSRYISGVRVPGTGDSYSIAHSSNGGNSWNIPIQTHRRKVYGLHAFPNDYNFLVYDLDSGTLFSSFDHGNTYPQRDVDSVYLHTLYNKVKDGLPPFERTLNGVVYLQKGLYHHDRESGSIIDTSERRRTKALPSV